MSEASVTIETPVPGEALATVGPLERSVSALKIVDAQSHGEAKEYGKKLTSMKRFVVDLFDDPKKKAHALHKSLTTKERQYLEPIEKTLSLLNGKITLYERAEQKRAEDEAAERQREADRIEQERTVNEAVAAEQAGDVDLAEAIMETPVAAPTVLPQPAFASVAGTSGRKTYKVEIVNLLALVKHVAANPDDLPYLEACMPTLNGSARALKMAFRKPGIRVVEEISRTYKGD